MNPVLRRAVTATATSAASATTGQGFFRGSQRLSSTLSGTSNSRLAATSTASPSESSPPKKGFASLSQPSQPTGPSAGQVDVRLVSRLTKPVSPTRAQKHRPLAQSVPESAVLSESNSVLTLDFGGKASSFDSVWLRDHCRCPVCFHTETKQRLVDTFEIPLDIQISSATLSQNGKSIEITFQNDNHKSVFDLDWLRSNSYNPRVATMSEDVGRTFKLWGSEITKSIPVVDFDKVMAGDEGLAEWLNLIDKFGIAFVQGVPPTPEATEALGCRISFIRETHYGKFWDFTANNAHADTAYTGLALQSHTDTTYFTDPIGLQLFHITEFTGVGGKSVYVDGFNAAAELKRTYPEYYKLLTEVPVPTHSAGDPKVVIAPSPRAYPILNIDPLTKQLYQVRWNNDDRSVLNSKTLKRLGSDEPVSVKDFYAALKAWVSILRDPKYETWIQLEPGLAVIVDNWRVLHGRSAFTGHRRVCGSYHGYDDYRSRVRDLCYGRLGRLDI
ncbi:hypothetical protein HDU79_010352 [Rhizoclosmatium sp. JEL0117]|nr:hypothetical protein HDU79_010352 [Rhizoclosmatium sp. JEL0117]